MADCTLAEANPFNCGAGHPSPNLAVDPGLVYDLTTTGYLNFLCSIGYNAAQISKFGYKPYECPSNPMSPMDLSYPSITIPSLPGNVTVTRTLKNVGTPAAYTVQTEVPSGGILSVKVKPMALKFEKINEEKTFRVKVEAKGDGEGGWYDFVYGRLIWSDGVHSVRSPLVVNVTSLYMYPFF